MHRILIVEDEEVIRKNIERLLSLEGFEVATAPHGQHGLVLAKSMLPDVIITDINMPVMDGFALLAAVRAHPELERCIVIMLTAASDRAKMREGMRLGADDYLTKPFKREELLDTLLAQLQKRKRFERHTDAAIGQAVHHAVAQAVVSTEEKTRQLFSRRYASNEAFQNSNFGQSGLMSSLSPLFALAESAKPTDTARSGYSMHATVMFADIRNFTTMAERLSAQELSLLLGKYFEQACRPVMAYGGTHIKMLGDGLLALFETSPHDQAGAHAGRAVSAALALREAAYEFGQWVAQQYGARGLPSFAVGIGLHSGEVTLGALGTGSAREVTPLGDSVNIASRLQSASKELGWTVVASLNTAEMAGSGLQRGREQVVRIRGRAAQVEACEVLGFTSTVDFHLQPEDAAAAFDSQEIDAAVKQNSMVTARAAKGALKESLWNLQSGAFQAAPQRFKGYEVIRKLGEGGMSHVFLAYSAAKKGEVVLKVLRTSMHNDSAMMRRFVQEYAVLATIEHHHIAKIYDQGFTDEYAYIAMEYLSGGSLKAMVAQRPSQVKVIDMLRQIVSALSTIHELGLVYRDLKPDNLMFRATGELVLVDFGIVKSVRDEASLITTMSGQVIGTPYYVSPEQASGKEVTNRSDFYSLGVIMYELLTGDRPYTADSLHMLLMRHVHGPVPSLPSEHARFQPFLNCLMAKDPGDRPSDCKAVWLNLQNLSA